MTAKESDLGDVADSDGDVSFECYSRKPTTCSSTVASSSVASSGAPSSSAAAGVAAVESITGRYGSIEQKYHIDSAIIGTGYQAYAVRECRDLATEKRYALKTFKKGSRGGRATDLHREVNLLTEVKHDNILQLVDVYENAGHLHIVTDLCRGGELYDRIIEMRKSSSPGCLDEGEASRIMRQVLAGVSYLHSRGIVHRDLKPENVMFATPDEGSPVKIIDFGLARKHHRDSFEPYMSTIAGSSHFLAPEVLRRRYDRACDAWAAGVTCFIALCGYPPFDGANDREVCDAVRRGRFKFQSRHWKGTSGEAKDFVRRLLRVNPRKRMTAEEALDHPWVAVARDDIESAPEGSRRKASMLSLGGIRRGALKLPKFRSAAKKVKQVSAGGKELK